MADRHGWPQDQATDKARRAVWEEFTALILAEILPGTTPARSVRSIASYVLTPSNYRCYPDVVGHLRRLRDAGVRTGIVSNFDDSLFPILDHLRLHELVDTVVTSYRFGAAKPAPEIFTTAVANITEGPAHTLMVGDSITDDVLGAGAAGLDGVLIDRHGLVGPEYRQKAVTSFAQLADAVPGYPRI